MSDATGNLKNHAGRIVRDKGICGGEPVFKGTRVTLRTVLASLADSDSVEEILADFPSLKAEDVQAAIAFTAAPAVSYTHPKFGPCKKEQRTNGSPSGVWHALYKRHR